MPFAQRLAWIAAVRTGLLAALFLAVVLVNVRRPSLLSFTVVVGLWAVGIAFVLSASYAWFLRRGKSLRRLAVVQLVSDQALWTVLVYLSGGVTSGATSFYGVTSFFGALLIGFRGAALAGVTGVVFFLLLSLALLSGQLPPPLDQPAEIYLVSPEEALYSVGLNALVLVIVALLAGNLAERLRAAGGRAVRAEARAEQAEREAALGRLAAGLAHEIRNPLGAISGSSRLLSANPELSGEDRELCDIIARESARLEQLVSDMLNLTRRQRPELQAVDAGLVADDVVRLSQHTGRGHSDVKLSCRADPGVLVWADADMLRQVIWNLVRNAVEASHPGQTVEVKVLAAQGRALLTVLDRGSGLEAEAKERLFDPFFTTRSHGTGIGLAVVGRIVADHQWSIAVDDTPGGGATFCVQLGELAAPGSTAPQREPWTLFPKGPG